MNINVIRDSLRNRERHTWPKVFPKDVDVTKFQRAAVLILLLPIEDDPIGISILFNQRSDRVPKHKGQIAFPGGSFKDEDLELSYTALRETYEENGIRLAFNDILGQFDDFLTVSSFHVATFIGYGPSQPRVYKPDGWEVVESFEVPLSTLLDDKYHEMKPVEHLGITHKVHYFYASDRVIWGVTGEILAHFLEFLNRNVLGKNAPII